MLDSTTVLSQDEPAVLAVAVAEVEVEAMMVVPAAAPDAEFAAVASHYRSCFDRVVGFACLELVQALASIAGDSELDSLRGGILVFHSRSASGSHW